MARMKKRLHSRCITISFLADPALSMWTTAMLSVRMSTVWPDHDLPQMARAIRIGRSSFAVISTAPHAGGHCSWNQSEPAEAPQLQVPDASDVTLAWGVVAWGGRKDLPFQ